MSTHSSQLSAANFGKLLERLIHRNTLAALGRKHRASAAGAPAKLSLFWLVTGLVFHVLQASGLLSTHIRQVARNNVSDSALSERRQGIGIAFFQALLDRVLQGIACENLHPHAFYKGFLLTGIDGSQWSVSNTPPIKKRVKKTQTRRRSAAFFKLSLAAIYELGTHNPLAARIGTKGESEMELALPLLSSLREGQLLIADRYYGVPRFVFHLLSLPIKTHFLLRVRRNLKRKRICRLADGSCLIEIRDKTSGKRIQLREIHASVRRRSGQWISIRLWTNLLDHKLYPAKELVALYGIRWEQEISYKELKTHLRRSPLLLSHTLVTAAQEVACLILAQAIVARLRSAAAADHTPLLQISFIRTLDVFRALWNTLPLLHDLLPATAIPILLRRLMQQLVQQSSPPRRSRSCPRALRQPISKWPRLLKNSSTNGPFQFRLSRNRS